MVKIKYLNLFQPKVYIAYEPVHGFALQIKKLAFLQWQQQAETDQSASAFACIHNALAFNFLTFGNSIIIQRTSE